MLRAPRSSRSAVCDWRTVRRYLAEDAASVPPTGPPRAGTQPLMITPFIPVVEAWLRADVTIKGTVVYERLVAEYGFPGHYQRIKMFLAEARPRNRRRASRGRRQPADRFAPPLRSRAGCSGSSRLGR